MGNRKNADLDYSESSDSSATSSEEEADEDRPLVPRNQLVELLSLLDERKQTI